MSVNYTFHCFVRSSTFHAFPLFSYQRISFCNSLFDINWLFHKDACCQRKQWNRDATKGESCLKSWNASSDCCLQLSHLSHQVLQTLVSLLHCLPTCCTLFQTQENKIYQHLDESAKRPLTKSTVKMPQFQVFFLCFLPVYFTMLLTLFHNNMIF